MNKLLSFAGRHFVPLTEIPNIVPEATPDTVRSDNELLNYIYGIDPVTGHPIGDLAFYLGENTRPEIRTFIETNLMRDMSSDSKSPLHLPTEVVNKFRSELSDDDIAAFSRNHGETSEDYANRIKTFLDNERQRRIAEKRESDYQKELSELRKKVLDD